MEGSVGMRPQRQRGQVVPFSKCTFRGSCDNRSRSRHTKQAERCGTPAAHLACTLPPHCIRHTIHRARVVVSIMCTSTHLHNAFCPICDSSMHNRSPVHRHVLPTNTPLRQDSSWLGEGEKDQGHARRQRQAPVAGGMHGTARTRTVTRGRTPGSRRAASAIACAGTSSSMVPLVHAAASRSTRCRSTRWCSAASRRRPGASADSSSVLSPFAASKTAMNAAESASPSTPAVKSASVPKSGPASISVVYSNYCIGR